jgi:hypothetical protein
MTERAEAADKALARDAAEPMDSSESVDASDQRLERMRTSCVVGGARGAAADFSGGLAPV